MKPTEKVLIIGAGPTGLGAALALQEAQHSNWTLLESTSHPGGLASSVVDPQGFTWDLGGHVLFSHYERFDRLMNELLQDQWFEHVRESWIWMRGRFIPYPLQNNIRHLPLAERWRCLKGLIQRDSTLKTSDFESWLLAHFGTGLYDVFLKPYNRKVWAYEPATLGSAWVGERVAVPGLSRIIKNVLLGRDDRGWGPNAKFRFPRRGGTGAIWQALYKKLPASPVRFGERVTGIHTGERRIVCESGQCYFYDRLLSTLPLDQLLRSLKDKPELWPRAEAFRHSSTHVIGVGIKGLPPKALQTKCWIYFPEDQFPFYRLTVFSNYSAFNVPNPGEQWSLMLEVSESPEKPINRSTLVDETLNALRACAFIPRDAVILSTFHRRLEYGYPTPFKGRDEILEPLDAELRRMNIWSRGRFGGWKYEVSNQDHSLMQGMETVQHWLTGAEEKTYRSPDTVNAPHS